MNTSEHFWVDGYGRRHYSNGRMHAQPGRGGSLDVVAWIEVRDTYVLTGCNGERIEALRPHVWEMAFLSGIAAVSQKKTCHTDLDEMLHRNIEGDITAAMTAPTHDLAALEAENIKLKWERHHGRQEWEDDMGQHGYGA